MHHSTVLLELRIECMELLYIVSEWEWGEKSYRVDFFGIVPHNSHVVWVCGCVGG